MHEDLIDVREAEESCGIRSWALRRWLVRRRVRARRADGRYWIRRIDLGRFLDEEGLPVPKRYLRRPRILIAEDNAELRFFLGWNLSRVWKNADIRSVGDGYEARDKMLEFKPELLITDYRLPGLDGICLAQIARDREELRHTKVIAITAYDDPETRAELLESGVDEFIRKPFEPDELLQAVMRQIGPAVEERRKGTLAAPGRMPS
ncbi:MAG TPA: response regulator [Elusimicrobiota bacterium]|nr:response regulator [Elusimicrobiota bacterium]